MQKKTCTEHGQKLDFVCNTHEIIICVECVRVKHIHCTGITSITSVAKNIKFSTIWDGINRNIKELDVDIKNVLSHISEQEIKLDSQSTKIETSVKSIFDKTIPKDRYEIRAIISDLKFKKYKCIENLKDFRKKVEEVEVVVCEIVNRLSNLAIYCSDSQIYREIVNIAKNISNAEETFKTLLSSAKTLTLHCESIKEFDFQINPLAKLQTVVHSEPFYVGSKLSTSQRSAQVGVSDDIKKIQLKKKTEFLVKSRRRLHLPKLLILNEQILLTGRMISKVVIHDTSGYFERDISIPDMPHDISVVNDCTVAVLLFNSIVLVNIITKKVETICTECSYHGLSHFEGCLYLLKIKAVGFVIDIMDLSGHIARSVRVKETDKIDSSCIITYKNKIFILSHTKSSDLYCFDLDGKMLWHTIFKLQYKSLQMAVDDKLNCYIPCYEDNSVRVVSNCGKHFTNILTDIKKPLALYFDKIKNRLIVYNEENQCYVFDVNLG